MEFMDPWILIHEHKPFLYNLHRSELIGASPLNERDLGAGSESLLEMEGESSNYAVEMNSVELGEEEVLYRHKPLVIVVLIVGYLIVFFFGLLGNFAVLIVIARTPRMSTVTNLFIANLACADLLVLIFCILPNLVSNIFVPWVLGPFLCKTVPYIQGVSVCASVYTLVSISVERCLVIKYPLHSQLTKSRARHCIIGIWIWSSLVAAPWAIFFDLLAADEEHPELKFCVENWPQGFQFETFYFLIGNLILCYLFPLGMISVCYIIIWLKVWRRPFPCDAQSRNSNVELIHQKAKAGVLKMLLVVVCMFALSWLPLYLIFSRIKFGGALSSLETEIISIGTPLAQWLGSSNSMWNPWIYAFLNVKFRRAFNNLFFGKRVRRDPVPHYQKPNVSIMLKRLKVYKGNSNTSSNFNVTDV